MPRSRKKKKQKDRCKDKYIAQRYHAKKRLLERYGIELTSEKRHDIIQQIATGKSKFLGRQSLRLTIHLIIIDDLEIPVIYDSNRQELVTFLQMEWIEETKNNGKT